MRLNLVLVAVVAALLAAGFAVWGATPHGHGLRCTYGPDPTGHHACLVGPR